MQHLQVKPWWNFTVAHSACPSCGGAGLRSVRPASPPLTLQEGRAPALQQGQEAALNEQPLSAEARMRAQVAVHERPLAARAPGTHDFLQGGPPRSLRPDFSQSLDCGKHYTVSLSSASTLALVPDAGEKTYFEMKTYEVSLKFTLSPTCITR